MKTGRRYLRFLKFIDAFTLAYNAFNSSSSIVAILETGKWSCMGIYLLLESFTIVRTNSYLQLAIRVLKILMRSRWMRWGFGPRLGQQDSSLRQ
jgi:hypothetical protein